MKLNGAAILIECLIEQGVGTVFGFPGGAVLPIYDELYKRQDRIRHVLTAHEQHAGHAADGYARASGKTGVCIATSGPGATNLVTPIATAYMDSTPIVFITGNVPQSLMGTDSFQEADISGMTMPVTKHNYLVTRVEKLADIVREAFFIASSGRPGPVLIDIPKDVQIAETEYEPAAGEALIPKLSMKHPTVQLRLEGEALERYKVKAAPRLEQAARLIAEAQKPLIYCGGGVILSGAERELAAFADLVDAPVVSTLMGLGAVPADNPRMLGMLGMHGTHAANIAMQRCDLLIAVGVRFSDRAGQRGDVRGAGQGAAYRHRPRGDQQERFHHAAYHRRRARGARAAAFTRGAEGQRAMDAAGAEHDGGIPERRAVRAAQDPPPDGRNRPGNHRGDGRWPAPDVDGAAFPVPASAPADHQRRLGHDGLRPGRGDGRSGERPGGGSFRMNLTELSTIGYYGIPVIVVIFNNGTLGMVRQWQTLFFGHRYSQTTLDRGPDFMKLAAAYGLSGARVDTVEAFAAAFKAAVEKREPCIIECMLDIDEMVAPMVAPGSPIDSFCLN